MRVLYDGEGFQGPFGGVPHSFAEIIKHLPEDVEAQIAVCQTYNLELQAEPFCLPACPDLYHSFLSPADFRGKWHLWQMVKKLFPGRYPDYAEANRRYFGELLDRGEFDVLHLTGVHVYGDAWKKVVGKKPIVITVHDLIPEVVRHDSRIAAFRREMLGIADQVIAVSENTKRDLMRMYGVGEEKVTVVYHGGPQAANCRLPVTNRILFVGGRSRYKNWAWMMEAVVPLLKEGMRLVCTGLPFSGEERRLLKRLDVADRVEQRTVSAAEFPALYASSAAFVYPSRYEGFGLPILDAWAAGCPVVLAKASCFPEIAGDAAEYFELDDAEGLRAAIARAKTRSKVEMGLQRVRGFTWEKSAAQTADVYRRVIG